MCKDCRWKCCLSLVQCQCLSGTHDKEEEIVVYKDEEEKDLVEIRRPWNFLGMRNEQYHCKHSFNECIHRPIHNCGSPHTEIEQDTWNIWKGTATASAHRTAVSWVKESCTHHAYIQKLCDQCICTPCFTERIPY